MQYGKVLSSALLLALFITGSTPDATAQDASDEPASSNPEVIGLINVAQDKLTALAGTMTDEQWAWRPGDGVRSTSEVLMHLAFANFFMPTMLGVPAPEDFPVSMGPDGLTGVAEYEGMANREEVLAELDASFDHIRRALATVPADRMDDEMDVFGRTMNVRGFCMLMATHAHEHLGQLVAYARTNGVVPPWSAGG